MQRKFITNDEISKKPYTKDVLAKSILKSKLWTSKHGASDHYCRTPDFSLNTFGLGVACEFAASYGCRLELGLGCPPLFPEEVPMINNQIIIDRQHWLIFKALIVTNLILMKMLVVFVQLSLLFPG